MFYLLADKLRRVHKGMPKPTSPKIRKYAKSIFKEVGCLSRLLSACATSDEYAKRPSISYPEGIIFVARMSMKCVKALTYILSS
jgi:hypothetical protein